jgi:hypothetical protein
MKWFRKNKQKIIWLLQSILVIYPMTIGFLFEYLWIWFKFGLPIKWWSVVLMAVLGLLSTAGTFAWIARGNNNE